LSPKEPDYLTTRELAELLRIKERKVYDLVSTGAVPCTRATGKLLFPRAAIDAWLAAAGSGPASSERPAVMLGSHDPLLEWALKQSGCGLASLIDGSLDGLDKFASGEGIAAGLHLYDAATGGWNTAAVGSRFAGQPVVLVEFCRRDRGLVVSPGAAGQISAIADLAGRRVVPRQPTAGTQVLLMELLEGAGVDRASVSFAATAHSETAAAEAVLEGLADATLGLRSLATRYRLGFVEVVQERFDLLVERRAWFEPPWQKFIGFCRSAEFRERAATHEGYDVSGLGRVHFNG
jgi:putative molybdopterin biosynthesis protein